MLEELDFTLHGDQKFWCIDGGAQEIAKKMRKKIEDGNKEPIQFHSQVTKINANVKDRGDKDKYVPITLTIKTNAPDKEPDTRTEDYFAVFNSTTLGAFERMELQDAGLLWGTKQAIRALGYGASCKVAIKFSRPWWQVEPFNINLGGVSRTGLPLRVCVYPSYNIPSAEGDDWNPNGPSVLLCSYSWGQDAQKIGSLISRDSPNGEEQLKSVLLHNLALLHANEEKPYDELLSELENDYVTHHAWDWYHDDNSMLFSFDHLLDTLLIIANYSDCSVRSFRLFRSSAILQHVARDHQAGRLWSTVLCWRSSICSPRVDCWRPGECDTRGLYDAQGTCSSGS